MSVLVVNAGSSLIKGALFDAGLARLSAASVTEIGGAAQIGGRTRAAPDPRAALALCLTEMAVAPDSLAAAAHRVVHGGPHLQAPCRITPEVEAQIASCLPLAPLHNPANLAAIRALAELVPGLPQYASFDTAFHATNPQVALHYGPAARGRGAWPAPLRLSRHLLCQYCRALARPYRRAVALAVVGIASWQWRVGLRDERWGVGGHDHGLFAAGRFDDGHAYGQHGRKGRAAFGRSPRHCRGRAYLEPGKWAARLGWGIRHAGAACGRNRGRGLCHCAFLLLGGAACGINDGPGGGLDATAFTGGIGEHDAIVRDGIMTGLGWTGLQFDAEANRHGAARLHDGALRVAVWLVPADEERHIAAEALELIRAAPAEEP